MTFQKGHKPFKKKEEVKEVGTPLQEEKPKQTLGELTKELNITPEKVTPSVAAEVKTSNQETLVESLVKKVAELEKAREEDKNMLLAVADKKMLGRYQDGKKMTKQMIVRLRTIKVELEGRYVPKVVLGWRMIKDDVYRNPTTGVWMEDQVIELFLEDGSSVQMKYPDFVNGKNKYVHIKCEVLKRTKDEDTGTTTFKLKAIGSGEIYSAVDTFVN